MRALEIENFTNRELNSVYYITGDDEYLKMYVIDALKATIPFDERAFAYVCVNPNDSKSINDVLTAADTFTFSSVKKMVDVSPIEFKLSQTDIKALKDYLKDPALSAFIVFEGIGDKDISLLSSSGEEIDCSRADESDLCKYVSLKLQTKKYEMKMSHITEFIRYCNYDFGKIVSELDKLMLYCLDSRRIDIKDVELLTPPDLELKSFELTNALNRGDYSKAVNVLQTLKERGNDSRMLYGMIYTAYRKLLQISISKSQDYVISKALGMSPSAINVNRNIVASGRMKDKSFVTKIKKVVEYLYELEYKFKTSTIDPDLALNLAVDSIIATMGNKK